MHFISNDIDISKEKEICLPKKESVSGHNNERTNMTVKCEMFINCSKYFMGLCEEKENKYDWQTKILKGS